MSPAVSTASRTQRGGGRVVLIGVGVVAILLAIGAVTADRRTHNPFDPRSAEPEGTKAMVDLINSFGADVAVPTKLPTGNDADVAVLFDDPLDTNSRDALRNWASEGHVLVVADPASELVPEVGIDPTANPFAGGPPTTTVTRGDCSIAALRNVDQLDLGTGFESAYRFVDPGPRSVCFVDKGGALVTLETVGAGLIVGLTSGEMFTNHLLGAADNAVLVTDLLAPRPGTRVSILTREAFPESARRGGGSVSLSDSLIAVIGPGVKLLMLELAVALVLLALASGRRLGRPISEPQPVQIAASELVGAVGGLLQQTSDPSTAASILRADLRRVLSTRLGVPVDAGPDVFAEVIAARTTVDRDYAYAVLVDRPVNSDAEFVALANHIEAVRQEVVHGHVP